MIKYLVAILFALSFVSCTYSITMVHTQGRAKDVIDDTDTPTANVTTEIPVSLTK